MSQWFSVWQKVTIDNKVQGVIKSHFGQKEIVKTKWKEQNEVQDVTKYSTKSIQTILPWHKTNMTVTGCRHFKYDK